VVAATGGEYRAGQDAMCDAVAASLQHGRHLVVEAPTGVGKSYAVAVGLAHWLASVRPTEAAGDDPPDGEPAGPDRTDVDVDVDVDDTAAHPRVVVATATRALQDQLVDHDLPAVADALEPLGCGFRYAVLKGRSNYLCAARAAEATGALLEEDRELATALIAEAATGGDGERSRLTPVDDATWRTLSVTAEECPGVANCSAGGRCWAEQARAEAAAADVIVVNSALYAAHLLAGGAVLPEHDAVVVDEAHALADVLVGAASVRITPTRLRVVGRTLRPLGEASTITDLERAADGLRDALEVPEGEVDPTEGDLAVHLAVARAAATTLARAATDTGGDDALQAAGTAAALARDLAVVLEGDDVDRVVWRDGDGGLACAPVEARDLGRDLLWPHRTVVCTSATLRGAGPDGERSFSPLLAALGAPADTDTLAVDSPFDHRRQAILYVPRGRIPSPKEAGWADGVADELWMLASAAGGRTLALFTSRAATEAAATTLAERSEAEAADLEILTQWDAPRHRLVDAMVRRRRVVVCATRSFWTGIDIPGDACVVVAIDRVPFPRPDDPQHLARRRAAEARGADPFLTVDLPAAATQLAQGVGRLIRSPHDRGVVAVLDTRLATARWRHHLLACLPDLRRSVDPNEVAELLADA
jgi:ATP-dependent DNA helicase DinG